MYKAVKEVQAAILSVYECRVPVIVGVHNMCVGGGIDLSSAADIRYCSSDAYHSL